MAEGVYHAHLLNNSAGCRAKRPTPRPRNPRRYANAVRITRNSPESEGMPVVDSCRSHSMLSSRRPHRTYRSLHSVYFDKDHRSDLPGTNTLPFIIPHLGAAVKSLSFCEFRIKDWLLGPVPSTGRVLCVLAPAMAVPISIIRMRGSPDNHNVFFGKIHQLS